MMGDTRYPSAVLFTSTRPWGKDGEEVSVYVLSLHALLKNVQGNVMYPKGRPSIFSTLAKSIPLMPYEFNIDLLKDCLKLYVSPYGPISDTGNRIIYM